MIYLNKYMKVNTAADELMLSQKNRVSCRALNRATEQQKFPAYNENPAQMRPVSR